MKFKSSRQRKKVMMELNKNNSKSSQLHNRMKRKKTNIEIRGNEMVKVSAPVILDEGTIEKEYPAEESGDNEEGMIYEVEYKGKSYKLIAINEEIMLLSDFKKS